jgi:hypothetical protein
MQAWLRSCSSSLGTNPFLPPTHAVRSRILSLLCRSIAAAQMFPSTILTIEEAVYGGGRGSTAGGPPLPAAQLQ